jgi:hypothetical protein
VEDPEGEAAAVFHDMAAMVDDELAPTRVYSAGLNLL